MVYRTLVCCLALAWSVATVPTAGAQSYLEKLNRPMVSLSRFHGTWFNATFIAELSTTHSFRRAMGMLNTYDPLWATIDTTKPAPGAVLGYAPGRIDSMTLSKKSIVGAGQKWVLGRIEQPIWIVSDDETKRSYIALTPVDSLEAEPLVLGSLPSRNPDPMFILQRMVNNSVLVGSWTSKEGKRYRFSNDMVLDVNGQARRYKMHFDSNGWSVNITTVDGQPLSWKVERDGATLELRPKKGAPIVLRKES